MGVKGQKWSRMTKNYVCFVLLISETMHHQGIIQKKYGRIGFLTKSKTIAAGGLGGVVSPQGGQGDALVKVWVQSP